MRLRKAVLLIGDIAIFYVALFIALWLRWEDLLNSSLIRAHLLPFSIICAIGLWIFYSLRLYDSTFGYGSPFWLKSVASSLTILFFSSVFLFYFFARSEDAITPRGTLFLFFIIFGVSFLSWRGLAERMVRKQRGERVIIFSDNPEAERLAKELTNHPQLGYRVVAVLPESHLQPQRLEALIREENLHTAITSREGFERLAGSGKLQELSELKVSFWDLASFYEVRLGKVPVNLISEAWILEHIIRRESPFETSCKQFFELGLACILLIITLPLWPFIALGVLISSPGPVFYEHLRVGQYGKPFILRKFRSMYRDAETHGPRWAELNDQRVTPLGKFLRDTHLDELPQLLSILRGELSFVGPRPERPEFVKELTEKIPFYDVRHLVKPGFTGWAQINYPYGASIEDAREKLEYDLYYLRHRSLLLDASIALKTLRLLFQNPRK